MADLEEAEDGEVSVLRQDDGQKRRVRGVGVRQYMELIMTL